MGNSFPINPAHALTFDPATSGGQAVCRLFQQIKDVEEPDGGEVCEMVMQWFADLGFDVEAPLTTPAQAGDPAERFDENLRLFAERARDAKRLTELADRWRKQGKDAEADELLATLAPPPEVETDQQHRARLRELVTEHLAAFAEKHAAQDMTVALIMQIIDGALWGAERETSRAMSVAEWTSQSYREAVENTTALRTRLQEFVAERRADDERLLKARDTARDEQLARRLERAAHEVRTAADAVEKILKD
jgi:hypothetical protein